MFGSQEVALLANAALNAVAKAAASTLLADSNVIKVVRSHPHGNGAGDTDMDELTEGVTLSDEVMEGVTEVVGVSEAVTEFVGLTDDVTEMVGETEGEVEIVGLSVGSED
jgi:hypothetical protein